MISSLSDAAIRVLSEQFGCSVESIEWKRPQEAEHGDIATPVCLQLSKQAGKNPREMAEVLCKHLSNEDGVQKAEVAGPGYVNLWLTADALIARLSESREACVPQKTRTEEQPVIVEYSQPNIAKPLGVHHLLSTLIGQSLSNLYRHTGYNTISINHTGDWGTQFGKLAVAVEKWGDGRDASNYTVDELLELYVRFHNEAEVDDTLNDEGRAAFKRLEDGDETVHAFWSAVVQTTMNEIQRVYDRLGIEFDHTMGESFFQDKMTPVLEEGKEKGVFTEGEKGALIAEFEDEHVPPAIVLKGDGATIYHTRDLATIRYRIDTWHPQSVLYVVDIAHQLYFVQLFSMVDQLGWDLPHLEHTLFGRMRFADKSMSTRKGNILKLEEVLEEAVQKAQEKIAEHGDRIQAEDTEDLAEMMGTGAVAYGILSQNRKMDIVFDWDKMLSFDGNSAPYVQYTHARARSVLRKAQCCSPEFPQGVQELSTPERNLLGVLSEFSTAIEEARVSHMPHTLAQYLYGLCQTYNSFYNTETIVQAEEPQRSLRLCLTALTADILRCGAGLLTIRVPDRM